MNNLLNWRRRAEKQDETTVPEPKPAEPVNTDDVTPPLVKPSVIPAVNYLRAFLILKKIPFKKLKEEFLKLPLKKIAWIIGLGVWAYMTYALAMWVFVK